jgi:hypothetical protein
MIPGFAGIGFMAYRRKSKPASEQGWFQIGNLAE